MTDAETETAEAFKQATELAVHLAKQTVSQILGRKEVSLFIASKVSIHSLQIPQPHRGDQYCRSVHVFLYPMFVECFTQLPSRLVVSPATTSLIWCEYQSLAGTFLNERV